MSGAFGSTAANQVTQQPLFGTQGQPTVQTSGNLSGGWPTTQPNRPAAGATTTPFGSSTNAGGVFGATPFGANSMSGGLRGITRPGEGAPSALSAGAGVAAGAWPGSTASGQPLALTAAPSQGTGQVTFRPIPSTETTAHGTKQVLFDSIAFLSGFESKSFEELRFEDYQQGNRGQAGSTASALPAASNTNTLFGGAGSASTGAAGLFGAKSTVGLTTTGGAFGSSSSTGANTAFNAPASSGTGFGLQSNTPATGSGLFGSAPTGGIFGNTGSANAGTSFGNSGTNATRPGGLFGGAASSTPFGATPGGGAGSGSQGFSSNMFGSGSNTRSSPFSSSAATTAATNPFGVFSQQSGSGGAQTMPSAQPGPSSSFASANTLSAGSSSGLGLFGSRPAPTANMFGASGGAAQPTGSLNSSTSSFGAAGGSGSANTFFGGATAQPSGGFGSGAPTLTSGFGNNTGNQVPGVSGTVPNFSFGGLGSAQTNLVGGQQSTAGGGSASASAGILSQSNTTNATATPAFQFGSNDTTRSSGAGLFGAQNQNTAQATSGLFRFGPAHTGPSATGQQTSDGQNFPTSISNAASSAWRPYPNATTNACAYQNAQGPNAGSVPGMGFGGTPAYGTTPNAVQSLNGADFRNQNASSATSPYGPLPVLSNQPVLNPTPSGRWNNEPQTPGERSLGVAPALSSTPLASIPNAPVTSYRVRPRSQVRAFSYGASVGGTPLDALFERHYDGSRGISGQLSADTWSSMLTPGFLRRSETRRRERGVKQLVLDTAALRRDEPTLTLADITTQEALVSTSPARFEGREAPNGKENLLDVATPTFGAEMSPIVPNRNEHAGRDRMQASARETASPLPVPRAHVEYHAQTRASSTSTPDHTEKGLAPWAPRLSKPGYYTKPPLDELQSMSEQSLSQVPHFVIGRRNIAEIRFLEPVDLRYANLNSIVVIEPRTVTLYPAEEPTPTEDKARDQGQHSLSQVKDPDRLPPPGQGLNRPALLRFEQVFRMDKRTGKPTTDPEAIERFVQRLREYAEQQGARFVSYDADTGTWELIVDQFG
ncbi:hypothetical protein F1559_002024 [Cyanidiococcus yangmingshanensis]|uniref:Peptidase S59 domain-containing protein n=1 Tax=Cyanidiococcus yangmingshanensis TaxID=2690220 RepID=A0A7J7IC24_9RHOD|nr:hypothetical protein F1559_002024 [Cyanidiococcus yangmingshanensis]